MLRIGDSSDENFPLSVGRHPQRLPNPFHDKRALSLFKMFLRRERPDGPEVPQMGSRSAKTIGTSPGNLYLLTESVDKVVAKAVRLGAAPKGPVMDMFWGDRCGTVVDPEGYTWMVATHVAEPTPQEMKKRMKEQMANQPIGTPSGS